MKSTIPDEWLQPQVNDMVAELNREATKDFIEVEKKVFDTLQKNNLDLVEKLNKAEETLEVILGEAQKDEPCIQVIRTIAYTTLKEIKNG